MSEVEPSLPNVMHALSAPSPASTSSANRSVVTHSNQVATDVKVKKKKKVPVTKTVITKTMAETRIKTATSPQAKSIKAKPNSASAAPFPKNASILLKHLGAMLNATDFGAINQTAASKATGIPMDSMTASLKRLIAAGHVLADSSGMFKLASSGHGGY